MKKNKVRLDRIFFLAGIIFFIGAVLGYTTCMFIYNGFEVPDVVSIDTQEVTINPVVDVDEVEDANNLVYLGEFKLTGYCPCEYCSEGFGTSTATGTTCTAGRTVAVDPTVIPYGTKLLINGHEYIAEDCGGSIKENRIDIYCDTHNDCFSDYCNGYASVYLVEEDI